MRARAGRVRFLGLALLALAMMAVGNWTFNAFSGGAGLALGEGLPVLEPWKLFQFQLSWADLGFSKRGLVGTLLGADPALGLTPRIMAAALAPTLGLALALLVLLARLADFRAALALAVSPALFWNLGYDLGRFDHLTALILLAVALPRRARWVAVLLPLMPLIHEASLVIHLPLAVVLASLRRGVERWLVSGAVLAVAVALTLFMLGARPGVDVLGAAFPNADPDSTAILSRTLADNMALALEFWRALGVDEVFGLALGLGLLWLTWRAVRGGLGRGWQAVGLAAIAPLGLGLVATDLSRWLALAVMNVIIAGLILAPAHLSSGEKPIRRLAWFGLLGPLGVGKPFSLMAVLRQMLG